MNTHQEISSFIWNVADDVLRGLFKQHEYGDVILPFVVLRRLDCVLEPQKDEVHALWNQYKDKIDDPTPIIQSFIGLNFFNYSQFDLSRLTANSLKLNFQNYLNGYSKNVLEIIDNFQLEKPVDKLLKNNRLYLLISKFKGIDLHPDVVNNHTMGLVFEELLRKFSEMSNETSGEHYTPRDVVKLLVSFVFGENRDDLMGEGKIRSIYDPCCGTGGMLTIGKEWVVENTNPNIDLRLYGQELNPQTYSICKSDMLITAENPSNIRLGSSLSEDQFQGFRFDYMITNPPFGVSWKSEQEFVVSESQNPNGRFFVGTPRSSDGSLLFLQHMISKMEPRGSRIGVVFNGSPLFTGDAGSGESEIRKWIIENDWLETIVALPDQLFFNTGISTYIWIVTNNKKPHRKGKVQLIDATGFHGTMKKSLGSKRKFITDSQRESLLEIYQSFKESEVSKIYPNEYFGFTKVTIERPQRNEAGKVIMDKKKKQPKADSSLRDYERIPLQTDIDAYFEKEVLPHVPDAWMETDKNKVGYEINFTKYFYQYKPLRSLHEITQDLLRLEEESDGLMAKLIGQ
ncbi:type I restriction-modification system subunit M [Persicitalea jodogahamensis]|uniref:site-specific DNA-methyltransferase (adenine-specific) n=1 Tax=Persicitalea jodogahamensis TaxID=402147 RepID=A0A8J3DBL1_9BACT|nr:class I SAM-dependent DNA methyltransferase [Persicitalea jodogahamensis]GHB79346.1 restriction endonuclease subunit M [Persicitalea jodogahamensis]